MKKIDWSEKSIFRKIIIIVSAIQILAFFLIPYASMNSAIGGLNSFAGALGVDTGVPNKLTGLSAVGMFLSPYVSEMLESGASTFYMIVFVMALISPLVILLLNLFRNGKAGYILNIVLSLIMTLDYFLIYVIISEFGSIGFSATPFAIIMVLVETVMFVVSIIGLVKYKNERSDVGENEGKTVKQGRHDGILHGVRGSYAGADIPLKNGVAVWIGRDPKSCSIIVKGENVSRKHCSVTYDEKADNYSVVDYSVNGVYDRHGKKLESGRATIMAAGDEIHIGATGEIFRLG